MPARTGVAQPAYQSRVLQTLRVPANAMQVSSIAKDCDADAPDIACVWVR